MSNGFDGARSNFVGMPRTRLGWLSVGLEIAFVAVFVIWILYMQATPMDRPTFFSDLVHVFLILPAAGAAITGAVVGVLALVTKRERSVMIVVSVLLGAFVLIFATAQMVSPQ